MNCCLIKKQKYLPFQFQYLYAAEMLKIALIVSLNVVFITAGITTLYEEIYVEWKLKNFFERPTEINNCLNSTSFLLANNKWGLQICPNGQPQTKPGSAGYINMYLMKVDSGGKHLVNFSMGFTKHDGSEFNPLQNEMIFSDKNWNMGWTKYIKRSTLLTLKDTLLPGDILTVFCKVRIVYKIKVISQITPELDYPHYDSVCNQSKPLVNVPLPVFRTACNTTQGTETLSDNLKDMYSSKRYTDIIIVCNNTEFSAHKNILSYRAPAFDSMLEKNPDKIEITDCDPESFEEFLRFIYTGKLEEIPPKKAMILYLTSDKFNMYELREECARYIAKHVLDIDSFCDILHFANLHSDSMLLMATTEFFITNAKLILLTEKWENFLADDPSQGNELFLAYVNK